MLTSLAIIGQQKPIKHKVKYQVKTYTSSEKILNHTHFKKRFSLCKDYTMSCAKFDHKTGRASIAQKDSLVAFCTISNVTYVIFIALYSSAENSYVFRPFFRGTEPFFANFTKVLPPLKGNNLLSAYRKSYNIF